MATSERSHLLPSILAIAASAGILLMGTGCGNGHDHGAPAAKKPDSPAPAADPNAKPYPLKTCVVSGEELGSMGEPVRITYKGQEIKFCCKECDKDFQKDPEKYLKKLAEAPKK